MPHRTAPCPPSPTAAELRSPTPTGAAAIGPGISGAAIVSSEPAAQDARVTGRAGERVAATATGTTRGTRPPGGTGRTGEREHKASLAGSGTRRSSRNGTRAEDDLVRRYLDEIGRYPLLSRNDEQELGRRMERGLAASRRLATAGADVSTMAGTGDGPVGDLPAADRRALTEAVRDGEEARMTFLLANLRLVVAIATREQRVLGMPLLDLVQEGNVGLMHAVDRFDWRRGFKFSTYATYWVREAMQRGSTGSMAIRVPRHQFEARARLRHAVSDAELRPAGAGVTHDQLADRTRIPLHDVRRLLPLLAPIRSLDEPVSGEVDIVLGDMVADRCSAPPEDAAIAAVERSTLHAALDALSPLEREIVCRRFGFGDNPRSLPTVARELDMTPERAQTILRRALRRLGRTPQIAALRRDLPDSGTHGAAHGATPLHPADLPHLAALEAIVPVPVPVPVPVADGTSEAGTGGTAARRARRGGTRPAPGGPSLAAVAG